MPSIAVTDKPEDLGLSSSRLARIGPFFEQAYVAPGRLPGVLTLVARRGQVASLACVGDRDLAAGRPVEADTIFRIYSMTKPITSVALMTLYEEGRFQLDDPVSRFLPELGGLRVWDDGTPLSFRTVPAERDITVRDLLTHTAGFTYGFMGRHPLDALYRRRGIEGRAVLAPQEGAPSADLAEMVGKLGELPAAVLARQSVELQRGHRRLRPPRRAAERAALRRVPVRADPRPAEDGRHGLLGHAPTRPTAWRPATPARPPTRWSRSTRRPRAPT